MAVRNVSIAIGIDIDGQPMFRHVDRGRRNFKVLKDVKVTGGSQPQMLRCLIIERIPYSRWDERQLLTIHRIIRRVPPEMDWTDDDLRGTDQVPGAP
jgi:hypothetical protein